MSWIDEQKKIQKKIMNKRNNPEIISDSSAKKWAEIFIKELKQAVSNEVCKMLRNKSIAKELFLVLEEPVFDYSNDYEGATITPFYSYTDLCKYLNERGNGYWHMQVESWMEDPIYKESLDRLIEREYRDPEWRKKSSEKVLLWTKEILKHDSLSADVKAIYLAPCKTETCRRAKWHELFTRKTFYRRNYVYGAGRYIYEYTDDGYKIVVILKC